MLGTVCPCCMTMHDSSACPAAHLRIGTTTGSAPLPLDPSQWQLLTDALDFIADNEWGRRNVALYDECLDCGAGHGEQHSEHCRWLAIMRRGGRR